MKWIQDIKSNSDVCKYYLASATFQSVISSHSLSLVRQYTQVAFLCTPYEGLNKWPRGRV